MIRAYVLAAWLLGLGSAAAAEPQGQRLPVRVGVVFGKGSCRVLQLSGPVPRMGTPVQVVRVVAGAASQTVIEAKVLRARSCLDGHGGPVDGHRVTLDLGEAELAPGEMAIGVVDPPRPVEVVEGKASVDLDGDGVPERFRGCTSTEGVHLTVWSGEPLQGPRRWHAYHLLGHGAEPTCTPADWREDAPAAAEKAKAENETARAGARAEVLPEGAASAGKATIP